MKGPRVAGCRANGNEGVGVSVSAGGRSGVSAIKTRKRISREAATQNGLGRSPRYGSSTHSTEGCVSNLGLVAYIVWDCRPGRSGDYCVPIQSFLSPIIWRLPEPLYRDQRRSAKRNSGKNVTRSGADHRRTHVRDVRRSGRTESLCGPSQNCCPGSTKHSLWRSAGKSSANPFLN